MIIDRETIETLVGTKISKIDLYQKAFTHKSALKENENLESFETLELIGDSVLGFVITKFLFDRYEQQKEGFLTKARTKLVRGETLAKIAMKLIIMSSALQQDMLIACTPLELAACFHLVEAYMHRDLYTYHCESDHCQVSAVSAPSAQKIATIALALLTLFLSREGLLVNKCYAGS